jgi:perosamine synthetase
MISVCEPVLDGNETRYVLDCLQTNWISSNGPYNLRFEESMAKYIGLRHAISCSSCTSALHLALTALGVGPGDEVIIPDFTLIVSANTVTQTGAAPVLVDVDPRTWCINPDLIEEKITPRTKAIMVVHMYGHPCDMPMIMKIAMRHGLKVIEDCAESHGAEINGKKTGGFGDISCFSFYGNKIITSGEGGMVLCDDDDIAARVALLCNQGFQTPRFVHTVMGFNYRLSNIQAAIGLAQMEKVEEKVARKRWINQTYSEILAGSMCFDLPYEAPGAKNVYWMYGIVLKEPEVGRDLLMERLLKKGVETRAFFCPMHLQPVFREKTGRVPHPSFEGEYPVSERLWNYGLYLPSGLSLDRGQIESVCNSLLECLQGG